MGSEMCIRDSPERIRVKYLDETNTEQELEADGLLATCIQHEMDHLEGILFIDHLTSLKRNMIPVSYTHLTLPTIYAV